MDNKQKDVGIFLRLMGHKLPSKPSVMMTEDPIAKKRISLIYEELDELVRASMGGDLAQVGGECVDLIYAVFAVAEAHGLDLDPFWAQVQKANLRKTPNPDGKPGKPPGWVPPDLDLALRQAAEKGSQGGTKV